MNLLRRFGWRSIRQELRALAYDNKGMQHWSGTQTLERD